MACFQFIFEVPFTSSPGVCLIRILAMSCSFVSVNICVFIRWISLLTLGVLCMFCGGYLRWVIL